ncbi:MAG: hypothetical protein WBV82_02090, partial [Myxococcaceae bacterium]
LGPQRFDVSIDGEPQEFNEGVTASGVTSGNTFELRVSGSSDPIKNAIDDESSLALAIQFDKAALDALPRDQPLRIHGLTSLHPSDEGFAAGLAFEPGEGNTPAVTGVSLIRYCFCGPPNELIEQDWEGTFELHDLRDGRLEVRTSLTLIGRIPYANTRADSRTTIEALVQVDTL